MLRWGGAITGMLAFSGFCTQAVSALPIGGRVVDYLARPVAGAEVAVYEKKYQQNGEQLGRIAGPVVRTDERGHFALEAEVTSQYGTFIVARKEGLALAWDGLNYSRTDKGRGRFLLVLERPCTIDGLVVDPAGNPVAGAEVQAVPKTSYHSRLHQRPMLAPKEWFTTRTDAAGRFAFANFSADVTTDFWVKAPALAATYKFTTHYQNCCGFEVGRPDIRLVLPQERKVAGRVIEQETGRPVQDVTLLIKSGRQREDITNLYLPYTTVSDAEGRFAFAGVPEGKHAIEPIFSEEQTPDWVAPPAELEVQPGRTRDDVEVSVTKGGLIEIVVRDAETGEPIEGMRAYASAEDRRFYTHGVTDARGTARLRVTPGTYEVSAYASDYLSWHGLEPVEIETGRTVRCEARLEPCEAISGIVRDPAGKAVAGVPVKPHPFGDEGYTDESGHFALHADRERGAEGAWVLALDTEQKRAAIAQVQDKTRPLELALGPALRATGHIADANGTPIAAARIALYISTASCLSSLGTETLTDREGRFELIAVAPPADAFTYRISVHATDYGPKTYERVSIGGEAGTVCDLGTITLPRADASISGIVVDVDGVPAPRIPLFLNTARDGPTQPRKSTATNEKGRFRMTRVCEGPLRFQANFSSSPGGSASVTAQSGQQDIRIVLPGRLTEPKSLLAKPLPHLETIAPSVSAEVIEDRAVLLCFFDMNQRPSRRCVRQLAQKSEELRARNIAVVVIQAAPIDPQELADWARSQDAPFPVVASKIDRTKLRLDWGVESLPWLILTDRGHVVRAEGFAPSELDDKIAAPDSAKNEAPATEPIR